MNGRLGRPQSQFGRFGQEKNLFAAAGILTPDRSAPSPVDIPST